MSKKRTSTAHLDPPHPLHYLLFVFCIYNVLCVLFVLLIKMCAPFSQTFLLEFALLYEAQRSRVDTIAETSRRRTIFKYMPI